MAMEMEDASHADSLREGKFGIHIGIAWDAKGNTTAADCQPTKN